MLVVRYTERTVKNDNSICVYNVVSVVVRYYAVDDGGFSE